MSNHPCSLKNLFQTFTNIWNHIKRSALSTAHFPPEFCRLSWRIIRTRGPFSPQSTSKPHPGTRGLLRSPWTSLRSGKNSPTTSTFVLDIHSYILYFSYFSDLNAASELKLNYFQSLQVPKFRDIRHGRQPGFWKLWEIQWGRFDNPTSRTDIERNSLPSDGLSSWGKTKAKI